MRRDEWLQLTENMLNSMSSVNILLAPRTALAGFARGFCRRR